MTKVIMKPRPATLIEAWARRMCREYAHDPNEMVLPPNVYGPHPIGPRGSILVKPGDVVPAWRLFVRDAEIFLHYRTIDDAEVMDASGD